MAEENNQSPFLEPSDHMCEEIARQAEFIFSDTSLGKDTFLLKHVKRNKEGFVNLKLLISAYKPIKRLTQDWRQIAFSIRRCSSKLEINELGTKIRRIHQLPCYDPAIPETKTVVATNFPMSSPTIKDVVNIFSPREIVQVRILRPGNPTSGDVKRYLASNPHLEGRVCAMVEFEFDLAQQTVAEFSENNCYNLEVYEYTEPPASRRDDRSSRELKKTKKKGKNELKQTGKQNKSNHNWGSGALNLSDTSDIWNKGREEAEEEGGEDDIGYSSDNEVIDNNEWTNLVNRTVAMVFEEV